MRFSDRFLRRARWEESFSFLEQHPAAGNGEQAEERQCLPKENSY